MTATVPVQPTVAPAAPTGPLTVPIEILRAAGARHRSARAEGVALPAWALLGVAAIVPAMIALALLEWRGLASILLIVMTLIGAGCAFALDVVGVLQQPATTAGEVEA